MNFPQPKKIDYKKFIEPKKQNFIKIGIVTIATLNKVK